MMVAMDQIHHLVSTMCEEEKLVKDMMRSSNLDSARSIKMKENSILFRIQEAEERRLRLYEDYKAEILDEDEYSQLILESLSLVRGPLACATYTQMLKLACDAFSKDYFSEHYRVLEEADYTVISREDYLKELERLDIEVGKKNNLGEIKSFVLLQVLSVMLGEQIYVFCSDDKNARNGATNFEDVRCISLVSVFSRLKEESNLTLADAEPYIESLIAFYQDHHQTTFRVMEASEVRRLQRIPCRQVLQEIFDGKFIELKMVCCGISSK